MALIPAVVAAWQRLRTGREPVPAEADGSHAAHFLRLLHGRAPAPEVARVLDTILTLHADHELNASTFAVRVAVATLADLHAAVVAAIATLKGPRHGGANEDVLAMLLEIGDPDRAEAYVAARLDAHARGTRAERADPRARMPGFGHRVYRVDDARARVLRQMAKTMAEATGHARLFEVAERVYAAMTARTASRSTSTSSRRSCTTRSASRATSARRSSRSGAWPAGAPTPSSSTRTTASSGRGPTTWACRRASSPCTPTDAVGIVGGARSPAGVPRRPRLTCSTRAA